MLPSGAADGNRQIAAVIAFKSRQPFFDESANIFHQLDAIQLCIQKFNDGLVFPRQRAQALVIKRIRYDTHIEYQISIEWYAIFECKRFK